MCAAGDKRFRGGVQGCRLMKKTIILTATVLVFLFSFSVSAQESDYKDIYEYSGISETEKSLDENARNFFDSENIDITDYNWTESLKPESIFKHIINTVKNGVKAPLKCGLSVVSIVLIAAAVRLYRKGSSTDTAINLAVTLASFTILFSGVWGSITASVNAVKSSSSFMLSFVPVYMGILSISGAPATATASGSMLLLVSELAAAVAAFGQSAIIGAYLALSIGSSVSPITEKSGLDEVFKKTGVWILSLCSTVLLGILGAKSAVSAAADNMSVRTAKFILGTCVPVAGNALSGAVGTVSTSLSVLKSSVGIYGVVALAAMLIPILLELLIWRFSFLLTGAVCEIFSASKTSKLIKSFDGVFSLLTGGVLIIGATFIISLSVVVSAGRSI